MISWLKRIATNPTERDIQDIRESCPVHMATHGIAGFAFGGFAGLFLASMSASGGPESYLLSQSPSITTSQQVKIMFKDLISRTWSSAKSFGKIGAMFAGAECVVEGYRGKHDMFNGLAAGCFTGGVLGRAGGPASAAAGCAGFAAFSAAIETVLGRTSYPDE
jgi:mitochondrial import inner membrane translocase subunit TIM22